MSGNWIPAAALTASMLLAGAIAMILSDDVRRTDLLLGSGVILGVVTLLLIPTLIVGQWAIYSGLSAGLIASAAVGGLMSVAVERSRPYEKDRSYRSSYDYDTQEMRELVERLELERRLHDLQRGRGA